LGVLGGTARGSERKSDVIDIEEKEKGESVVGRNIHQGMEDKKEETLLEQRESSAEGREKVR